MQWIENDSVADAIVIPKRSSKKNKKTFCLKNAFNFIVQRPLIFIELKYKKSLTLYTGSNAIVEKLLQYFKSFILYFQSSNLIFSKGTRSHHYRIFCTFNHSRCYCNFNRQLTRTSRLTFNSILLHVLCFVVTSNLIDVMFVMIGRVMYWV